MAGIDKTYVDNYKDYKEFKDWAEGREIIFFDGHKEIVSDWIWDLNEEDFDDYDMPIMNTPTWLDIYFIQNCDISFVAEQMKGVYSEDSYNEFKTIDLSAKPSNEFQQNRKIVISRTSKTKFPLHSVPFTGKTKWWIQSNNNMWYNGETKTWVTFKSYYPIETNTAHIKSVKGIIRHLRKQYLRKGDEFRMSGRYVGESYLIKIK